ncbi:hypothetical protein ABZ729_14955 [Streptomyces sp. NPDC006678]|uniref:hypothetical protein n=1 Tax=Streptomyces sp. NPDC006678 TaxID=3157185 RepID=UPI00340CFC05
MFVRRSAKPRGALAEAPSLLDRAKRAGRVARTGVFLILALLALTLAVPGTAHADFACDFTGDDSYQMDTPGTNGESLMPATNQWEDKADRAKNLNDTTGMVTGAVRMPKSADQYTLYELNGMRGMNWSMTFKDKDDGSERNGETGSGADDCEIMDYVNNGVADMVFNGTKILTRTAISIKESASNPSPLSGLYEGRDNVVKTLKRHVFIPAVPVMIALTGLWVFTKWRKGEMREVWSGVGWASLTTIAVVALLTGGNYDKVIDQADSGIAQANSFLTEAVLSGASGEMQSPCDLPKEADNRGLRISSCAMYDTLAFRPWALGQFGEGGTNCIFRKDDGGRVEDGACLPKSAGTKCDWGKGARCEDLRARQVVAQSMTNKDIQAEKEENKEFNKYDDDWVDIRIDLTGGVEEDGEDLPDRNVYDVAYDDWAGKNAGNRVGLAFYSLIAALIVGLMVIVLSALTLLWHAVTLILIILLPLVATLGIHPSQQKLLKGWLETFIHSFVLRAGFGVILTVLLVLYQMILPAKIALGMQLLLLVLVTVAVVMMLKKLLAGNFSPQIAGAQDALGVRDMANTVSGKVADKAPGTARATGRVAGNAAARVGRGVDGAVLGGRLQKGGWLPANNSKRQQRKSAHRAKEMQQRAYESQQGTKAGQQQPPAPEPEPQPTPRRSGRVSASAQAPAPTAQPPQSQPQVQPQARPVAPASADPRSPQPPAQIPAQQPPQQPYQPPRDDHRMPR